MTEAAEHKILVPGMVGLCRKASKRSERKIPMQPDGGSRRQKWLRFQDLICSWRGRRVIPFWLAILYLFMCWSHTCPKHDPTHVYMLHPHMLRVVIFCSSEVKIG